MKRLLALILSMLLLAACQSTDNGAVAVLQAPPGPLAFRVGNTTVTVEQFRERVARDIGQGIANLLNEGQTREQIEQLAVEQNVRPSIMDSMIQELLLVDTARRTGVGIDPATVDEAITAQAVPLSLDATPFFSDTTGLRLELVRQQLVLEMIAHNTRADMFRARHMLVDDEAAADRLLAELATGKDFATLAAEFSKDTATAAQGGELGWKARGDYASDFEDIVFSAELNKPLKVPSQFGWHVLEVFERVENRPFDSFEQLRSSQSAQLFYEQSFLPWYTQLRSDAEASGDVQISPTFDPNSVPLPFP
jgi:peptidyl-prolyl cis-trans isomerase C